jgi:nucleoside-diphosphate-sugar epimerase
MKCLVTGGAGFIGSHLCDRLIAEGNHVVCIDNFSTGKRENVTHLLKNSRFELVEADCSQPVDSNIKAEFIFHFASPASPPKYQALAIETLLVNTMGTYYLLERAREWEARILFASTSEVYGDPQEHPQKETYWGNVNPNGPRSCYDESKRAGEAFMAAYNRQYGIDARMIRIFNTYGPRMDIDDGRVVTNFIQQMFNKKPITIYGDGKQTRSFCYVSDLIEGIMKVVQLPTAGGEVFNLGNPHEQTVVSFAEAIAHILQMSPVYEYQPLPEDDPLRRQPDISKAITILGWEPKISLEEGLRETINYFRKQTV